MPALEAFMNRLMLGILSALVTVWPPPLVAQVPTEGARIRVTLPGDVIGDDGRRTRVLTGTAMSGWPDTVALRGRWGFEMRIPTRAVSRIEVSVASRSRALEGAAVGITVGIAFAAILTLRHQEEDCTADGRFCVRITRIDVFSALAVLLGGLGGVVGAGGGSSVFVDRWEAVPPPRPD